MFLISKTLNKTKLNSNKEALKILFVRLVLIDADLLPIWMNNFQLCFRFHLALWPILPAVLIISRGECRLPILKEKTNHENRFKTTAVKKSLTSGKFRWMGSVGMRKC